MKRALLPLVALLAACGAPAKVRPVFTHFDAPLTAYLCGAWQVTAPDGTERGVLSFTGVEVTGWNSDGEQRSGFWRTTVSDDPGSNGWHPLVFSWWRSERNGVPVIWAPPTELKTEAALRERDRMILLDDGGWSELRRVAPCETSEGLPANWPALAIPPKESP